MTNLKNYTNLDWSIREKKNYKKAYELLSLAAIMNFKAALIVLEEDMNDKNMYVGFYLGLAYKFFAYNNDNAHTKNQQILIEKARNSFESSRKKGNLEALSFLVKLENNKENDPEEYNLFLTILDDLNIVSVVEDKKRNLEELSFLKKLEKNKEKDPEKYKLFLTI